MKTERERLMADAIGKAVRAWARENCPDDLDYGSPYSYYANAKHEGIVTEDEMQFMARYYGELWHYRGD